MAPKVKSYYCSAFHFLFFK